MEYPHKQYVFFFLKKEAALLIQQWKTVDLPAAFWEPCLPAAGEHRMKAGLFLV